MHSSKIPLVLTTKVTHLRSLLSDSHMGLIVKLDESILGVVPKHNIAVSGLRMLIVAST